MPIENRSSTSQPTSDWGLKIYENWFFFNKKIVETFKQASPALGVFLGMASLEGHTLLRAAWYSFSEYGKSPESYGLEQIHKIHEGQRPVLLIHGAAGSWPYLGDLATSLTEAKIPVFVISLGTGAPTEEKLSAILEKVQTIQDLYRKTLHKDVAVDLVAHSMGGNLALAAAFTKECSFFDKEGDLQFNQIPSANPNIGKVVALALPSNAAEVSWFQQAGKINDLFNINAKYDALMGHKQCAPVLS